MNTGAVNPCDYGNIRSGVKKQNVARLSLLHGLAVQRPGGEFDSGVLKRARLPVRPVRLVRTLVPAN